MNASKLFNNICIVSCGVLKPELNTLQEQGFFNPQKIIFTSPGLHEWTWEFQKQLPKQLKKALLYSENIIVLYGDRCFLDPKNPSRITDTLIKETCKNAVRVNVSTCVDMLADFKEREKLEGNNKIYWITPGWIKNWKFIFKDWDKGKANEMFPGHDKAVILDGIGFFNKLMFTSAEKILEISDWMNIPLESVEITLDRLKYLLEDAAKKIISKESS